MTPFSFEGMHFYGTKSEIKLKVAVYRAACYALHSGLAKRLASFFRSERLSTRNFLIVDDMRMEYFEHFKHFDASEIFDELVLAWVATNYRLENDELYERERLFEIVKHMAFRAYEEGRLAKKRQNRRVAAARKRSQASYDATAWSGGCFQTQRTA